MHWTLGTFDRHNCDAILRQIRKDDPFRFRDEYRRLACSKCGRIDELKAIKKGINKAVKIPSRPVDIMTSDDGWDVVSSHARDTLEKIKGVRCSFFPIPSRSDYFVMVPKKLIRPELKDIKYTRTCYPRKGVVFHCRDVTPCQECGRPNYGWNFSHFDAPSDTILSGVVIEIEGRMSIAIIMNDDVVKALEAAKLTGWRKHALKS